jgi:hypothetical protein
LDGTHNEGSGRAQCQRHQAHWNGKCYAQATVRLQRRIRVARVPASLPRSRGRLRRHDEWDDVFSRFEARPILGRSMLSRKRPNAHAVPRAPTRNSRLENVRLVTSRPKLLGKGFALGLRSEARYLQLIAAIVTGPHSVARRWRRINLRRVGRLLGHRIARSRDDRARFEDGLRRKRDDRQPIGGRRRLCW